MECYKDVIEDVIEEKYEIITEQIKHLKQIYDIEEKRFQKLMDITNDIINDIINDKSSSH